MVMIVLVILSIIVGVGSPLFMYHLQKKNEENQELKNIIQNVHEKVVNLKNSPVYATAPEEIKKIFDYVATNTSSTTALNPSPNFLKNIRELKE